MMCVDNGIFIIDIYNKKKKLARIACACVSSKDKITMLLSLSTIGKIKYTQQTSLVIYKNFN